MTEQKRALAAFVALSRSLSSVEAATHGHLREAGLTATQFGVLEALLHLGPMCQAELGAKLLKSGANLTFVLDNMDKTGLVERERGTEDRRRVTVRLTAKGRALVEKVFPRHAAKIARSFSVLTAAEQEQLRALCRKLGRGQHHE